MERFVPKQQSHYRTAHHIPWGLHSHLGEVWSYWRLMPLKHSVNSEHHKRLDTPPQYQPKLSQVPNLWKPDLFTKTSLPLYSMKPHPSSAKNQAEKGKIYKCYKDIYQDVAWQLIWRLQIFNNKINSNTQKGSNQISPVTIGVSAQPSAFDGLVWVVGGHCSTDRHSFQFHLRNKRCFWTQVRWRRKWWWWWWWCCWWWWWWWGGALRVNQMLRPQIGRVISSKSSMFYARVVSGKSGARKWMNVRQDLMRHSIHQKKGMTVLGC